jgi:hypothetical protein
MHLHTKFLVSLAATALVAALSPSGCSDPASPSSGSGATQGGGAAGGHAPDAGPDVDAFLASCARVDACAASDAERIGVNGCYALRELRPWRAVLGAVDKVTLEAFECKLAAESCDDIRACEPALEPFTEFCAEKVYGDHCAGNTWVVCDDGTSEPLAAVDCGAAGLVCGEQFGAGCGLERCEYGVTKTKCDGDTLIECAAAGVVVHTDCRVDNTLVVLTNAEHEDILYTIAGEVCGVDNKDFKGEYRCIGAGAPCSEFAQRCDGTVLETCTGGYVSRRDCGDLDPAGMSCGFFAEGPLAGAMTCGAVDTPCSAGDDESCDDGIISLCALTRPAQLDCRALGYAGCETGHRHGRRIAWCTP